MTDFEGNWDDGYTEYTVTVPGNDKTRARIIRDKFPNAPEDDSAAPLLRLEHLSWSIKAEQVPYGSYAIPRQVFEGAIKWSRNQPERFERYLRMFHGATKIIWKDGDRYSNYVAWDPADWREEVGAPEGAISLTEWTAYVEGDVWGIVIEKPETWVNQDNPEETEVRWRSVESVWGFYEENVDTPESYTLSEAKSLLEAHLPEVAS